jgi:predicted RNase H-like HicB family nuclease
VVTEAPAHLRAPGRGGYVPPVSWHFTIELEREDDGRWIAEIPALPGVLAYGATEAEAFAAAEALALRVLADRLDHARRRRIRSRCRSRLPRAERSLT